MIPLRIQRGRGFQRRLRDGVILGIAIGFCDLLIPQPIYGENVRLESLRQEFSQPARELQSRPLWFWNVDTITPEVTAEITERSANESGYAGFGILPCFGPKSNADGIEVYLTEEYFARYGAALEAAKRYGMTMCLYDEYWFPSGAAGGWLAKKAPEAIMQELVCEEESLENPGGEKDITVYPEGAQDAGGTLMSVVAIERNTGKRMVLSSPEPITTQQVRRIPAGSWRILSFYCRRSSQPLVDYLNADAVRKFIEITHEEYYRRFPDHFGTTIDSVFYDEPPLYRVNTWTPAFNRKFREKYAQCVDYEKNANGEEQPMDPAAFYPDLFFDLDETTPAARALMFGMRSELFATEYIGQMDAWCRAHGVKLTGHMDQEQIQNPTATCGDLIGAFLHQEIPGIDEIGHFGRTQNAYKLISSAAINGDQTLVMSETYGAIGGMAVDDLYRIAMDEYAKGINLLVPHAVWYDSDPATIIFEPELSWRHPTYGPELPRFNAYIGRLNRLLQRGTPVVDIAVFYPIATLNAGYRFGEGDAYQGGGVVPEADYLTVGETLSLDVRRDFTWLHPTTLRDRCTVDGNHLQLENIRHPQTYRTLILPGMRIIDLASLRRIEEFYHAGGNIVATTRLPDLAVSPTPAANAEVRRIISEIFAVPSNAQRSDASCSNAKGIVAFLPNPTPQTLRNVLETIDAADTSVPPDVEFTEPIAVTNGNLTYLHRTLPECEVYFFANSSDTPIETTLRLRGEMSVERWDPYTGEQSEIESTGTHVTTEIPLRLSPRQSVFVIGIVN